ncbi:MAG: hypothetical protein WA989_14220 [Henriciella sp.]|uniref:hypothetical protein n=1 Tax=Henriciella sp. TaxID=1968823 RepID=UPI003C747992
MLRKLLWAVLLLSPLLLVLGWRLFAPAMNLQVGSDEALALRQGAAIASCEAPFDTYYKESRAATMSCGIREGGRTMIVETPVPAGEGRDRLRTKGANWIFNSRHSQNFEGRTVRVEIIGSCEGCEGQAKAIYATGNRGNSGWQSIDLKPDRQAFTFEYDVPVLPEEEEASRPTLILNSGVPDAVMYIDRILIVEAAE